MAYCDRIFFAGNPDLWNDRAALNHVLHELEHIVQCQRRGGRRTFLAEYVLKASMDIVKNGTFGVHDIHDFEVAAQSKADAVTPGLWSMIATTDGEDNPDRAAQPLPPFPQISPLPVNPIPLRFCQTPGGVCSIPPVYAPAGTACFCMTPYGNVPGSAY